MAEGKSLPSKESTMPWFDAAMEDLATYSRSPEGEMWFREFENLMERIQTRSKFEAIPEIPLTPVEEKALAFIRSQSKERRLPGVRRIAKAAGFRPSRSGLKLLHALKSKGLLKL